MQQPSGPTSAAAPPAPQHAELGNSNTNNNSNSPRRPRGGPPPPPPPKPEELVAHYESQGLDEREASLKVIGDLQAVLYRTVAAGRGRKDRVIVETARKIDNANSRVAILEMKIDSKPGFVESFAIGVASGAAVKGIAAVLPQVIGALGNIWNTVRSAASGSSQNS